MKSPTRRVALAVSVALLLVTAGCLGWTAPSGTSASSTPENAECTYDAATAASNVTGAWSPNASVEQYPPGVADNGTLVNASTLYDAHFDVTANTSMALRLESSRHGFVRTLVHGPDRVPFYSTHSETHDGEQTLTEFYGTHSHGFAQVVLPNETRHLVYQNASNAGVSALTGYDTFGGLEDQVSGFLHNGNYTVNGTVERGDRTFVELTVDEDAPETDHITNGTALVTPDGVVYDVDSSFIQTAGDRAGERFEASMSLNTDIEWCGPPSWVGDVPQLSLSIVEDGKAVEIRNTGGAAVPANTSFDIYGADEPARKPSPISFREEVNGTVTTDERLEPGEAVYVTADADGTPSSFALHDDPTRGEYTFGYAALTGYHGNTGYRLATGIEPPDWAE
jgi:predicted heme/steroid binding protein